MRVAGKLVHGPCLGDYPHIGADANGFYITTNEFYVFSPGFFTGAQIYAFSKAQLAAGAGTVNVVQFDTSDPTLGVQLDGTPGFTVWPAISTGNQFEGSQGGTEYFVSSEAVFQDSGADSRLRLWAVSNTGSLDSTPALGISPSVVNTIAYAVPGRSNQKPADVALATCLSTIHPCVMRVGHTFRRTSPINDGFDLWPAPLSGCEAVTASDLIPKRVAPASAPAANPSRKKKSPPSTTQPKVRIPANRKSPTDRAIFIAPHG